MAAAGRLSSSSRLGAAPDTYLYALASSPDFSSLATIGSDDSLRLFDASCKLLKTVLPCHAGVSCLTANARGFVTGGRDGLVKLWDHHGHLVSSISEPQGRGISAVACHKDFYIAAGTESTKEGLGDVGVLVFDIRNPTQPFRVYSESHTDTITQLTFHPTQPHLLLSASTDGLVSFFDINQADEDDALQQVLNPRSAVHCAGMLTDDQAFVLTTDEQFKIYPLAEKSDGSSDPAVDFGDVRKELDCMYVVGLYHDPHGSPVIAYGHNEKKTLNIVQLQAGPHSWKFGQILSLDGAHGEEVIRDMLITAEHAITCGEDGQVKVWQLAAGPSEVKGSKKRREKKRERYAPY